MTTMKYSFVKNEKVEAFPKGRGNCIFCNGETIAKCGLIKMHHWAHKNLKQCDTWWENETEWHRRWKSYFPKEWQEVVHFDEETGEKHIADVKTDKGIVLEFQNSPMSIKELESRENFYKTMLWVINGTNFEKNFNILGKLPNPKDNEFSDIAFESTRSEYLGRGFFRYSENLDWENNSNKIQLVRSYPYMDIEKEVEESYIGHHLFDWKNPRETWVHSKNNVFIDFGGQVIWQLMRYDKRGLPCVKSINKEYFIKSVQSGVYI